jgi:5'-nucleotidase
MRIICDLDSIVVDLMSAWLRDYNAAHNDSATEENFLTWDMHKHVKGGKAIYGIINQPGYFRHLPMLPGAEDALKTLVRRGHEVYLVTAASFPVNYVDKIEWCAEYLPFIDKKNVVVAHAKHIIPADAIIDDGPHNAEAYRKAHPNAQVLTIGYPYNKSCPHYTDILGYYTDTASAWAEILELLP